MLPQYKNRPDPVFHKFVVFSIVDDNDEVVEMWQGRTDQNKRIFFPYDPVLKEGIATNLVREVAARAAGGAGDVPLGVRPDANSAADVRPGDYVVVQVTEVT